MKGKVIRVLYRRLITLYPPGFREQLGESMEQTFNDLFNEKWETKQGLTSFVLRTFLDTAAGIAYEAILLFTEGDTMKTIFTNVKSPALISLLIVLPFMLMEVVNTQNFYVVFNIPLFGIMWLLPTLFIVVLIPIVQNIRAGNTLMAHPLSLLLRVILLLFIAWFWSSLVIDQMPCFLGVPNCD
ncbi:MAG: hypothetical protein DCC56_00640 [Anaerolineae bacterium]|nr:MAG: hypothetical protein DCC56_00640 [Anaerolineae bacterium]WKZ44540.1 MAG: hypothetical protein QY302_01970 [Anaerolineales bacterium]